MLRWRFRIACCGFSSWIQFQYSAYLVTLHFVCRGVQHSIFDIIFPLGSQKNRFDEDWGNLFVVLSLWCRGCFFCFERGIYPCSVDGRVGHDIGNLCSLSLWKTIEPSLISFSWWCVSNFARLMWHVEGLDVFSDRVQEEAC